MKKIIALFTALCLICGALAYAASEYDITSVAEDTADCLTAAVPNPTYGVVGGEWLILGLSRYGYDVPDGYYDLYYNNLCETLKTNGGIFHKVKYTEYSRVVIALSALGKDPTSVCGYDVLSPLFDYEKAVNQGINGAVFALLALDCGGYSAPDELRGKYLEYIASRQNADGGFPLHTGGSSDADTTAMTLQALAPYQNMQKYRSAVDSALGYISSVQLENGGFENSGVPNCESVCQVITALASLGIDIGDLRFVKNGNSVLDALMNFYIKGKGFRHTADETSSNAMASEQALYALTALDRYCRGKTPLYQMIDVARDGDTGVAADKKPAAGNAVSFADISGSKYEDEIKDLAKKGIINGKSPQIFDPDATMTRAEFAAIAVKALGLELQKNQVFSDVNPTDWHFEYIAAAYKHGIIKGISDAEFAPESTITREQAAVMTMRCAAITGAASDTAPQERQNLLAQFDDCKTISDWASEAMAFCVKHDMLDSGVLNIEPQAKIMRCEVAHMFYRLLKISNMI